MSDRRGNVDELVQYIEGEIGRGKPEVTISQNSISLDDAVNLALRAHVTLILANGNYTFATIQNRDTRDSDQ